MKTASALAVMAALALTLVLQGSTAEASGGNGGYSLFGDARFVHPGYNSPTAVQIRSDVTRPPGYGGVDFAIPGGMTFQDLAQLSTDFKMTEWDCAGGSPRFQVNVIDPVNGEVNIFVYLGPPPSYTGCPLDTWANSGNLMAPSNLIDTSQLTGGTSYDPVASAKLKYGNYPVTGIQIVIDGSWTNAVGGVQTAHVDNVRINNALYTFDNCGRGKGDGHFKDKDKPDKEHHMTFHKGSCGDSEPDEVSEDDEDGHHFQSSSVNSAAFDYAVGVNTLTMTGTGVDDGLPVGFTMIAIDNGSLPGVFTLILTDGRTVTGPVIDGLLSVE